MKILAKACLWFLLTGVMFAAVGCNREKNANEVSSLPMQSQQKVGCDIGENANKLSIYSNENKYGIIDEMGKMVVEPTYDYLELCSNGLVLAEKDYKYGIIDKRGNTVLDFVYSDISYSRGKFYLHNNDYEIGVADNKGKVVVEPKYTSLAELYQFELAEEEYGGMGYFYWLWRDKDGYTVEEKGHLGISMTIRDAQGDTLVLATTCQQSVEWDAVRFLYNDDGSLKGFLSNGGVPYCFEYNIYDSLAIDYGKNNSINDDVVFDLAFDLDENKPYYVRFYFERDEQGRIIKVYDPILHLAIPTPYDGHFEYLVKPEDGFGSSDINYGGIDLLFFTAPNDPEDQYFKVDTFYYYTHGLIH